MIYLAVLNSACVGNTRAKINAWVPGETIIGDFGFVLDSSVLLFVAAFSLGGIFNFGFGILLLEDLLVDS